MKRKIYKLLSGVNQGLFALALMVFWGTAFSQTTYTFNYTGGQQTMALQPGTYTFQTWGANGGDNLGNGSTTYLQNGGKGGYSIGTYTVTTPTTVYINVGGIGSVSTSSLNVTVPGGYNGGGYGSANTTSGKSSGAGGGGASHIATASGTLGALATNTISVLIVGGGGGGAGECNYVNSNTQYNSNGGNGGGISGMQNPSTSYQGRQGQGGTQTAGGGGGDNASATAGVPLQGIFGAGGYNPTAGVNTSAGGSGAGGGGGGWYGGGAGWVATGTAYQSGSGGGGSGYIGGVSNGTTLVFGSGGYVSNPDLTGNGRIHITELCSISLYAAGNTNSLNPILCSGQSATLMTNAVSNYSWSTGASSSSLVVSPTTNTFYTLSATSPSNCTTSRTISITVSSGIPVLAISNPSNSICLGQSATLTASGAISYTWTNPGVVNGQTFTPASTQVYTVSGQNGCGIATATTAITVAPLPVAVLATPSLVCEGYASTLTAVASVGNYTWMPGTIPGGTIAVSPMANTVYTVTASDGICSGTQTLLVNTKPTPTITSTASSTNICQGESVVLTVSGAGTGGSYSWTPVGGAAQSITISPNSNTLITVFGTNSVNCTASSSQPVVVNSAPPLVVSANKTLTCVNGQVNLSATGAGSYNWVGGPGTSGYTVFPATALTVYTVIGGHSTNTCIATRTIAIAAIIPNVSVTTPINMCEGGTATLIATGATSYTWNNISVGSTGQLPVQPTSNSTFSLIANTQSLSVSCITNHTAQVIVNPNPTVTVNAVKNTICKGETHTLTANGASSYSWSTNATTSVITVSPNATTVYTVTGTNSDGCSTTMIYQAKVNACTGLLENVLSSLQVYPNPSNGNVKINSESDMTLRLTNTLGQLIQVIELNETNGRSVQLNGLAKGVYHLSSGTDAEQSVYTKLIVN